MKFFCVYVKYRKKFDKMIKNNNVKNKYIIDVKRIQEEEEVDIDKEKTYMKILIYQRIKQAMEKKKDIYYIPDFEADFSIEKLLNVKKLLGVDTSFNILVFYNDFKKETEIFSEVMDNLSKFDSSSIIRDY